MSDDRFYFKTSMIGYNIGLFMTIMFMSMTMKPQPALLYILPSMTVTYLGGAFMRRETIAMAKYDEDDWLAKFEVRVSRPKQEGERGE